MGRSGGELTPDNVSTSATAAFPPLINGDMLLPE